MCGTRPASKAFGSYVIDTFKAETFDLATVVPITFVSAELDVSLSCHGDDFLTEGASASLDVLDDIMKGHFEVKFLPRVGPPEHGG